MVRITEELVRKKSEHNELIISTLEEISLHQEDIEKIEHIQNWCRDLKILLFQSNLISKIENLHKLKKLEYLNLAINNIEKIENLEKLESLNKLDLTLNFIGELTSVESLRGNYNLRYLILTGNPCTDYPGYRDYVITVLPQLETLDVKDVKISDRIAAAKDFKSNRERIVQEEIKYKILRDEQKIRVQAQQHELHLKIKDLSEEEQTKAYWDSSSEHCPETRREIAEKHKKGREPVKTEKKVQKVPILFAPCGRPYNLNKAKLKFHLNEGAAQYELDLKIYKFLDTSLIDVDVQPNYVRVTVKGKIFQLVLNEEVRISDSTCQRSQITGHLLITMPKLKINEYLLSKRTEIKDLKQNAINSGDNNTEDNLKGPVNYKDIAKGNEKQFGSSSQGQDEMKLPALI